MYINKILCKRHKNIRVFYVKRITLCWNDACLIRTQCTARYREHKPLHSPMAKAQYETISLALRIHYGFKTN